jgi:hypothetical protein
MSKAIQKILYFQLFVPIFSFGQGLVNCSLLTVTDVIIQNDSITFEIYNADNMDTHYPFIEYTLDAIGDTIQKGQMDWFVTPSGTTSSYFYTNNGVNFVLPSNQLINIYYPLYIYFKYSNLTGQNPGGYTCELLYNPLTKVIPKEIHHEKILLKTLDILGREVKHGQNEIIIDIFDDGSYNKCYILE